jgi:hypothetical protein
MVSPENDVGFYESGLVQDRTEPPLSAGERLIRAFLMVGFLAVLAIEAWLLWQVWIFWS